jgi:hypothetical protein
MIEAGEAIGIGIEIVVEEMGIWVEGIEIGSVIAGIGVGRREMGGIREVAGKEIVVDGGMMGI